MADQTELNVNVGVVSVEGIKPVNEDNANVRIPESLNQLHSKGICCALADGVSTAEAGKLASDIAVNQFINDYYLTPETWSAAHAGQKVLSAINLSLFKKSHEFQQEEKGYLCTFVGLVFKSQTAHFFHVGDSRLYRFRDGEFKQITRDHSTVIGEGKSYLTRALGMDNNLHVDYGKLDLLPNDKFIISTDGMHEFVSEERLIGTLESDLSAQQKAEQLTQLALSNHSDDNISCVVAEVETIPSQSLDDLNAKLTRLPFPPFLEPGMKLDGYEVIKEIFASPRSQLYLVKSLASQEQLIMKTPSKNYQEDIPYIDRFIQEEWIGKRLDSPNIVKVIKQSTQRTCLYYLMEPIQGISLDDWLEQNPNPSPKVAIGIIKQIAAGLDTFHKNDTIHQDLRPANIMIDDNHHVTIVDFGSTFVAGTAELFNPIEHEAALGTATYSDPQYLLAKNPGIQGDIYSLATIAYELFCGKLPYGDKIEDCQTSQDYDRLRYRSASHHNPIIPIWFDRALEKGVQLDTEKRYATLGQFLTDLTTPNPKFLVDVPEAPNKHNKVVFWSFLSGSMLLMLVVVFVMFNS